MDMQGSDHAPVWADWKLGTPLPTPDAAAPLSTRYMFTGQDEMCHAVRKAKHPRCNPAECCHHGIGLSCVFPALALDSCRNILIA